MPISDPIVTGYPHFISRAGVPLTTAHLSSPAFAKHWPALQAAGWICGDGYESPTPVSAVYTDEGCERLHAAYEFSGPAGTPEEIKPAIFILADSKGNIIARYTHEALGPLADTAAAMFSAGLRMVQSPEPAGA